MIRNLMVALALGAVLVAPGQGQILGLGDGGPGVPARPSAPESSARVESFPDTECPDARARCLGRFVWDVQTAYDRHVARNRSLFRVGVPLSGTVAGAMVGSWLGAYLGSGVGLAVGVTLEAVTGYAEEPTPRWTEEGRDVLAALAHARALRNAKDSQLRDWAREILAVEGDFDRSSWTTDSTLESCRLSCPARAAARQEILVRGHLIEKRVGRIAVCRGQSSGDGSLPPDDGVCAALGES